LSYLLTLFANNVLPIILAAGAGYLLAKYIRIDPRSVSQIAFKIFIPCLIFQLLTTSNLNNDDILRMGGYTVLSIAIFGICAWILARTLHFKKSMVSALLLIMMFGNAGNYGLSLNKFAFGDQALAYASIYFATATILINTAGVVIASLGTANIKNAVLDLLKTPVVYALLLAIAFNYMNWQLPTPLSRTVSILAAGAVPLMIVLMGIQLYHSHWTGQARTLSMSVILRLVVSPILAVPVALIFGLQGAALQAGIAQSAMPVAVMMTILATEYNVEPSFITMSVVLSTVLSPVTITPLLALLGA
jgi:predicted permease